MRQERQKTQDSRLRSIEALSAVLNGETKPKESVESITAYLDKRERSFVMELVYGVLRYRDTLDALLKNFLKNPEKLGTFTLNNLRAAVYQIYFMRVPDWAAVNESVEIEKAPARKARGNAGLVNAVLRNLLREREQLTLPLLSGDPVTDLSVNTSHPRWMVSRWAKRFGIEEAARICEANNVVPRLTIRTNTLLITREELLASLAERGIDATPTEFSPEGITFSVPRSYEELSFAAGLFAVQDEASQLISHLLGPRPGERVLDACAAPGGKTTHIAQLMKETGEVVAVEKDERRIWRISDNLKNLGIRSVQVVASDAAGLGNFGSFDRVLLDAPCSATGVIRRNPDIKYRRTERDFATHKAKQLHLLRSVSRLLRDGGVLVYSVCSMEPEEGEEVVAEFLKTEGEFRIIDVEVPFLKDFSDNGFFRTFPHRRGMDGFFGVSFCKKG